MALLTQENTIALDYFFWCNDSLCAPPTICHHIGTHMPCCWRPPTPCWRHAQFFSYCMARYAMASILYPSKAQVYVDMHHAGYCMTTTPMAMTTLTTTRRRTPWRLSPTNNDGRRTSRPCSSSCLDPRCTSRRRRWIMCGQRKWASFQCASGLPTTTPRRWPIAWKNGRQRQATVTREGLAQGLST